MSRWFFVGLYANGDACQTLFPTDPFTDSFCLPRIGCSLFYSSGPHIPCSTIRLPYFVLTLLPTLAVCGHYIRRILRRSGTPSPCTTVRYLDGTILHGPFCPNGANHWPISLHIPRISAVRTPIKVELMLHHGSLCRSRFMLSFALWMCFTRASSRVGCVSQPFGSLTSDSILSIYPWSL